MGRRLLTVVGGIAILWVVAVPVEASAEEACDVLDVACLTDQVAPDPTADDAGDVADDAAGQVGDVLDQTGDTVDPIADPILDLVDDLLGGGGVGEPPVDGDGSHHGRSTGVEGRHGSRGPSSNGPTALQREGIAPPVTVDIGSASGGERPADPAAPSTPGGFAGQVVGGLLLVLVLFGISVAFVTFQDRMDRHDPKLALAPVRPMVVIFE